MHITHSSRGPKQKNAGQQQKAVGNIFHEVTKLVFLHFYCLLPWPQNLLCGSNSLLCRENCKKILWKMSCPVFISVLEHRYSLRPDIIISLKLFVSSLNCFALSAKMKRRVVQTENLNNSVLSWEKTMLLSLELHSCRISGPLHNNLLHFGWTDF
jgi:hypothetical protein